MLATYAFILLFFKWYEKKSFQRLVLVLISIIAIQTVVIVEKMKLQKTNQFMVFQKNKETVLGNQLGALLIVDSSENSEISDYPLNDFVVGTNVQEVLNNNSIRNFYNFKNERILVIDSLGLYHFKTIQPTILLLRQSPKVNLNRVIKLLKPKLIISDGSNYKSYVTRWKQSCRENKTPFYNTSQNGAYIFE